MPAGISRPSPPAAIHATTPENPPPCRYFRTTRRTPIAPTRHSKPRRKHLLPPHWPIAQPLARPPVKPATPHFPNQRQLQASSRQLKRPIYNPFYKAKGTMAKADGNKSRSVNFLTVFKSSQSATKTFASGAYSRSN